MTRSAKLRALIAGWIGGFAGNALAGALFSTPWVKQFLYDPSVQSPLFIALTPQRNIAVSVAGLIMLCGIHGLLYATLSPCIPGRTWMHKGLWWGIAVWAQYWLFQEWFIYVALLGEPAALAVLELSLLLPGALLEGLLIAGLPAVCGNDERIHANGGGRPCP
jgi:hypothetical protein